MSWRIVVFPSKSKQPSNGSTLPWVLRPTSTTCRGANCRQHSLTCAMVSDLAFPRENGCRTTYLSFSLAASLAPKASPAGRKKHKGVCGGAYSGCCRCTANCARAKYRSTACGTPLGSRATRSYSHRDPSRASASPYSAFGALRRPITAERNNPWKSRTRSGRRVRMCSCCQR